MRNFKDNFLRNYTFCRKRQNLSFDLRMRSKTIKLNSAIENSKLVKWIRNSPQHRIPTRVVRNGRIRKMPWYAYGEYLLWQTVVLSAASNATALAKVQQEGSCFSSCCGILAVVVCFAFCRSSCQEADRRFLHHRIRGFHTGILAGSLSLSLRAACICSSSRQNRNASAVLEICPAGITASDIPDNARSIKRIDVNFSRG